MRALLLAIAVTLTTTPALAGKSACWEFEALDCGKLYGRAGWPLKETHFGSLMVRFTDVRDAHGNAITDMGFYRVQVMERIDCRDMPD